ncbi:MAG: magnesium transporter CorA family protein [Gemmatimonadaceae bacterium]
METATRSEPEAQLEAAIAAEASSPRAVSLDAAGKSVRLGSVAEIRAALACGTRSMWVDLDATDASETALLADLFGFHPVSIDEARNPETRVKVEEFDDYLFVIVRTVGFLEQTEDDPYDLETVNLACFLGRNFLVTARCGKTAALDGLLEAAVSKPHLLAAGPARLLHLVLNEAVDEFFPILDRIEEFLDDLEERVFANYDQATLRDMFSIKRLVLTLRRHLAPERDVFTTLANRPNAFLTTDAQRYFRDSYDKVLRINDGIETYRELLSNTLESYLMQISNRLGSITKTLSIVATISVPFVVVSGMWGMNVVVPFANEAHGFWTLLGVQLALGALLLIGLRWRRIL